MNETARDSASGLTLSADRLRELRRLAASCDAIAQAFIGDTRTDTYRAAYNAGYRDALHDAVLDEHSH